MKKEKHHLPAVDSQKPHDGRVFPNGIIPIDSFCPNMI